MMEYLLITMSGILGSAHCVGMCGPFAILLGQREKRTMRALARQLVYSSGRVLTYAMLGAMGAFGAWRLGLELRPLLEVQAFLSILAGLLLVGQALVTVGWLRRPVSASCPGAAEFAALLKAPTWTSVFVAGILNGFLPCGLVYAYLALSSSRADVLQGAFIMVLFGLGTWPAMILTGMAGTLLQAKVRSHALRVASAALFITGALTISRGIYSWSHSENDACPFCTDEVMKE